MPRIHALPRALRSSDGSFTVEGLIVTAFSVFFILTLFLILMNLFLNFVNITEITAAVKMGEIECEEEKGLIFIKSRKSVDEEREFYGNYTEIKYLDLFNYYLLIEEIGGDIDELIGKSEK